MGETLCTCTGPGARTRGECTVMREARLYKTPEGRQQLRDEYAEELREATFRRESKGDDASMAHHLQKIGVPADDILTLRKPDETTALQAARKFIGAPRDMVRVLLLLGPNGVGKSVAAAAVLQAWARTYPWNQLATGTTATPAMMVEARKLTRLTTWGADDSRWLDSLLETEMLVLDDVGDEGTPTGCTALADLVLSRFARRRRTVLTGNLRWEPFAARYGSALADRVKGSGIVPNLWGEKSLRGKYVGGRNA